MSVDGPATLQEMSVNNVAAELGSIRALLEAVLASERAEILQVSVGNFDRRQAVLVDSPTPRAKRLIVPRYGQGGDNIPLATAPVLVLAQNEGRMGGYAVNRGATNGALLYLCSAGDLAQSANRPAIWLPANGVVAWDFRLGNVLYGGPVCAAAAAATTNLTIAEF
jgi:hypothetical protein